MYESADVTLSLAPWAEGDGGTIVTANYPVSDAIAYTWDGTLAGGGPVADGLYSWSYLVEPIPLPPPPCEEEGAGEGEAGTGEAGSGDGGDAGTDQETGGETGSCPPVEGPDTTPIPGGEFPVVVDRTAPVILGLHNLQDGWLGVEARDATSGIWQVRAEVYTAASAAGGGLVVWQGEFTPVPGHPRHALVPLDIAQVADLSQDLVVRVTIKDGAGNTAVETLPLHPVVRTPQLGEGGAWPAARASIGGQPLAVNLVTGNGYLAHEEFTLPAAGLDLILSRAYNHQNRQRGLLGYGWRLSLETSLRLWPVAEGRTLATWQDAGGTLYTFDLSAGSEARPYVDGIQRAWPRLAPAADGAGYRLRWPGGEALRFDDQGRIEAALDHLGTPRVTYEWAEDRLQRVVLPQSRVLLHYTDAAGAASVPTLTALEIQGEGLAAPLTISFSYDEAGNLSRVQGLGGREVAFAYDDYHRLTQITHHLRGLGEDGADGTAAIHWAYGAGNRLQEIRHTRPNESSPDTPGAPVEEFRTLSYPARGTAHVADPAGVTIYGWDKAGRPAGSIRLRSLDPVDPPMEQWVTYLYRYDGDNLVNRKDPLNRETTFAYDQNDNPTRVVLPGGEATVEYQYTYGPADQVQEVRVRRRLGQTVLQDVTEVYQRGRLVRRTVHKGDTSETTTYEYHATGSGAGQIRRITDPYGFWTEFDYNAWGLVSRVEDHPGGSGAEGTTGASHWTAFLYDGLGRVRQQTVSLTPGQEVVTEYQWDWAEGQVTIIQRQPAGAREAGARDTHTQVTLQGSYLPGFRPVQVVRSHGDGQEAVTAATYRYSTAGMPLEIVAGGETIRYKYDALGRLRVQAGNGALEQYRYDFAGRLTDYTNPLFGRVQYTYDPAGRLLQEERFYEQMAAGATVGTVERVPVDQVTYQYDALDRPVQVESPVQGRREFVYRAEGSEYVVLTRHHRVHPISGQSTVVESERRYRHSELVRQRIGNSALAVHRVPGEPLVEVRWERETENGPVVDQVLTYRLDGRGRVVEEIHGSLQEQSAANTIRYGYDGLDRPVRTEVPGDPAGESRLSHELAFDAEGNLYQEAWSGGQANRILYSLFNQPAQFQSWLLSSQGQLRTSTWAFQYEGGTHLQALETPAGGYHLSYDGAAYPTQVSGRAGGSSSYQPMLNLQFDAVGNPIAVNRNGEYSTRFEWDAFGRLVRLREPYPDAGADATAADEGAAAAEAVPEHRWYWQPAGLELPGSLVPSALAGAGEERPAGLVYDQVRGGYLVTHRYPDGSVSQVVLDQAGNVVAEVDNQGHEVRYEYDALGRVTAREETVEGRVRRTEYTYDAAGRVLSITDPNGHVTRFRYEDGGRRIIRTDPDGDVNPDNNPQTMVELSPTGQPLAITDANGNRTEFRYDARGNLVKVISPLGHETRFEYDGFGNLSRVVNPLDEAVGYERDALGRVTAVVDPTGAASEYAYNHWGQVAEETNREDHTTTYQYDEAGRLLQKVAPSVENPQEEAITTYVWDDRGRHVRTRNPEGLVKQYAYDERGFLIRVEEFQDLGNGQYTDRKVTEYRYDDLGRRTYQKDADGKVVTYQYNEAGQLIREESGAWWVEYAYDANGNRILKRESSGETLEYEYDPLNRLTTVWKDGEVWKEFAYDPVGNLISETTAAGTTVYTYTPENRLETVTDPFGNVTEYVYDPAGNVDKILKNGQEVDFEYDEAGRVTSFTDEHGYTYAYEYDADGYVTAIHLPNGLVTHIEYDARHQVVRQWTEGPGGVIADGTYDYDRQGFQEEAREDGRRFAYRYDDRGQMREVETPRGDLIRYYYDKSGNLIRREAVIDGARVDHGETISVEDLMAAILLHLKGQEAEEEEEADGEDGGPPPGKGPGKERPGEADGGKEKPKPPRGKPERGEQGAGEQWPQVALAGGAGWEAPVADYLDAGVWLIAAKGGGSGGNKGGGSGGSGGSEKGGSGGGSSGSDKGGSGNGGSAGEKGGNKGGGSGGSGGSDKGGSAEKGQGKEQEKKSDAPGQGGAREKTAPGQAKKDGGAGTDTETGPRGQGAEKGNSGKARNADPPGQSGDKGKDKEKDAPGQGRGAEKRPKLKGIANALSRGKGRKVGLYKKWVEELGLQTGLEFNLLSIIDNIVNGEYLLPPGEKEDLFALVREVGAGYTIVGSTYFYNDQNQLLSRKNWVRDEIHYYHYDAQGNMVSNGRERFTWNAENQLVQVVFPDGEGVRYEYDARGRRLSQTTFNHKGEGQHTIYYEYDGPSFRVLRERKQDGEVVAEYSYGPDGRPLTMTYQGETYWYVYNAHGDVVALTDRDGNIKARYEYDEWGRLFAMYDEHGQVREGYGTIGDVGTGAPRPPIGSHPVTEAETADAGPAGSDGGAAPLPPGQAKEKPGKSKGRGSAGPVDDGSTAGQETSGNSTGSLSTAAEPESTSDATQDPTLDPALLEGDGEAAGEEIGILGVIGEPEDLVKRNPYRYAGYRYDRVTQYYYLQARYYAPRLGRFLSMDEWRGDPREPLTLNRYIYSVNNPVNYADPRGYAPMPAITAEGGGCGLQEDSPTPTGVPDAPLEPPGDGIPRCQHLAVIHWVFDIDEEEIGFGPETRRIVAELKGMRAENPESARLDGDTWSDILLCYYWKKASVTVPGSDRLGAPSCQEYIRLRKAGFSDAAISQFGVELVPLWDFLEQEHPFAQAEYVQKVNAQAEEIAAGVDWATGTTDSVPSLSVEQTPLPQGPSLAGALGGALILLDENFGGPWIKEQLIRLGYNVVNLGDVGLKKGVDDARILQWARQNRAWILTANVDDFPGYGQIIKVKGTWRKEQLIESMRKLKLLAAHNPSILSRRIILSSGWFQNWVPPQGVYPWFMIGDPFEMLREAWGW